MVWGRRRRRLGAVPDDEDGGTMESRVPETVMGSGVLGNEQSKVQSRKEKGFTKDKASVFPSCD